MEKRSVADQVKGGFRLTGLIFYFLGIAGLFVAGVAYAFFPTGHSRALGWIFLAVSIPIMLVEINRWAKVLPGILGLAVLNGLISVSTGMCLPTPPCQFLE